MSGPQPQDQLQESDPLDSLLELEDGYYNDGYKLGLQDGRRAGMAEGRAFGMEKAFEKYSAMGRMHGRAVVWAGRLTGTESKESALKELAVTDTQNEFLPSGAGEMRQLKQSEVKLDDGEAFTEKISLRELSRAPRLAKHVRTLWALTEPESLAVANEEEGVSDFDDRFKRAVAKMRIVGKMVGEDTNVEALASIAREGEPGGPEMRGHQTEIGIEDVDILKVRH